MDFTPGSWPRRLIAHLTTPLFAALLGWIVFQGARGWDDLLASILLCYGLWLLSGLGVALFVPRRGPQRGLLFYAAIGAVAMLPLAFLFGNRDLASALDQLLIAPAGAAVGAYYWLCAHLRAAPPGRGGAETA